MKPLEGVTVLDFTHALAGPFCTYNLGLLGAEIIKIEPPNHGDDFRGFNETTFIAVNGGKKSVTLDLKRPEARPVLDRLIAAADVAVDNFRPGAADRFGLEWSRIRAINPKLIYCSISGFGLDGPLRDLPAVEWSVQAASGLTSQYVGDDADPRELGLGVLDISTGHSAVTAILAALFQRSRTGEGQRIDTAMIDTALMLSGPRLDLPEGAGGRGRRPAVGRFRAKDRRVFIMGAHQRWFTTISEVLGGLPLVEDERFATPEARDRNAEALLEEIEARLQARTAAEWEAALTARGVPASIVRTLRETATHPHVAHRGSIKQVAVEGRDRASTVMGAPFKFERDGPDSPGPVPALGQHTEEVLARFGVEPGDREELRRQGVI
jgi:CoA:oxalate CoA-transferase